METGNVTTRTDHVLLDHKAAGQIMACAWAGLQSEH